jgi:hypothetical protein
MSAMFWLRSRGANAPIARPSNVMRPASSACAPAIARKSVDFPAPFGPTIASTSPARTVSETSSKMRQPP